MTDNTTYREKGRALFLAALMVLSVFAMSTALVGGAAAQDATVDDPSSGLDGEIYFAGQQIEINNLNSTDTVQLRSYNGEGDTTHQRNIGVDANGSITLDTSGLDGQYIIRDGSSDYGPFEVTEQNVEFEFSDEEIEYGASTTLDFVSDNRADDVNLVISADNLSEDDLLSIFDAEATDEDGEVRLNNTVSLDQSVDADFSGIDAGDYTFTVSVEDTTAEDTAEITVGEQQDLSIAFDQNTYQETVGDEIDIGLDLTATDSVSIDVNYDGTTYGMVNATNIDAAEDEELTLVFNTYSHEVDIVNEDGDSVVADADIESDFSGFNGEPLPALDYELEAYETADRNQEVDAAVMILEERSTDGISTHVAPANLTLDDDAEDFLNHSTERDYVADGDYLITQVDASGLYGYMLNDDGTWDGDNHGLELNYEQTNVGPFESENSFNLSELNSDNYQIHEDADEDTFYVIFNTDGLDNGDLAAEQVWNASFTVNGDDNPFVDEGEEESVNTEFDVEERNVEFVGNFNDDDQLEVSNSAESQISAETNVAPGTPGSYYLRFQTEVLNGDLTVDDDGMLTATLDLSDYDAGEELRTVRLSETNGAQDEAQGIIVEGDDDGEGEKGNVTLDVSAPDEINVGEDAEFDVTVTNNKDEEVTTTVAFEFDGESEESELTIDAGSSASETFTVSDLEKGEYDWSVSDSEFDLSDDGTLTVVGGDEDNKTEDNSTEDDSTDDSDDNDSDDSDSDDSDSDDSDSDDDGQPGFGVAVAIVALLAAAMLALRRQD